MVDIAGTVDTAVDSAVDALPVQHQQMARDAVDATRSGLSGAWDTVVNFKEGIASGMETKFGFSDGVSNSLALATLGLGALLTGSFIKDSLTSAFQGSAVGLVGNGVGAALTLGAVKMFSDYMNGTGPFAPPPQLSQNTPGMPADTNAPAGAS